MGAGENEATSWLVTDGAQGVPVTLVLKHPSAKTLTVDPGGHPATMSFDNLSVELLEQIISGLHYFDICNMKLVGDLADNVSKNLNIRV